MEGGGKAGGGHPGRAAVGRGSGVHMARVTASVDIFIYSFFVLRMFANPSIWMILNLSFANPKQELKVMQE